MESEDQGRGGNLHTKIVKQEPAQRFIKYMKNNKDYLAKAYGPEHTEAFANETGRIERAHSDLPSSFQLDEKIQVVFPDNGKLQGRIIKVSFTDYGKVLYDVEVPFSAGPEGIDGDGVATGYFRIHGLDNWFISYTQEDWDKMRAGEEQVAYSERRAVEEVNRFCEESLPPELFEKWVEVQGMLHSTRRSLKSTTPNTEV
jgi:hypothetical protein